MIGQIRGHTLARRVALGGLLVGLAGFVGCAESNKTGASAQAFPQSSAQQAGYSEQPSATTTQPSAAGQQAGQQNVISSLAYPTGEQASSVLMVEKIAPREVRVNQPYEYQIRVTNLTGNPLEGVSIQERLPENFRLTSAQPQATGAAQGAQQFNIGRLGPRESRVIRISGTATAPGTIGTCAAISYNPTVCSTINVIAPVIRLSKQTPRQADVCQAFTYHYTVTNTGTGTERNVRIEDPLPEGLQTEDGRQKVTLNVGDLPQGVSRDFDVRIKASRAGEFASAAVAHSVGGDARTEPVTTRVVQPQLTVRVNGPQSQYINEPVTYQITVTNNGGAAARDTTLRLDPGGQAQFVGIQEEGGAQVAGAREGLQGAQNLGTINPGQSRTINVIYRGTREGALSLGATANAVCAQTVNASASTEIRTIPALRLEAIDMQDPVRIGNNVVYRINVLNQGSGADRNVQVVVTLPPELQFVRATGSSDATAVGQKVTFTPIPTLEPGKNVSWVLEAKALRPGDIRFHVDLTSQSIKVPGTKDEPTRLF